MPFPFKFPFQFCKRPQIVPFKGGGIGGFPTATNARLASLWEHPVERLRRLRKEGK